MELRKDHELGLELGSPKNAVAPCVWVLPTKIWLWLHRKNILLNLQREKKQKAAAVVARSLPSWKKNQLQFQLLWGGILVPVLKQNIQLYDIIVYNKSTWTQNLIFRYKNIIDNYNKNTGKTESHMTTWYIYIYI